MEASQTPPQPATPAEIPQAQPGVLFQVWDVHSNSAVLVNATLEFAKEYAGDLNETHYNDSHSRSVVEGDRYRVVKTPMPGAVEYVG